MVLSESHGKRQEGNHGYSLLFFVPEGFLILFLFLPMSFSMDFVSHFLVVFWFLEAFDVFVLNLFILGSNFTCLFSGVHRQKDMFHHVDRGSYFSIEGARKELYLSPICSSKRPWSKAKSIFKNSRNKTTKLLLHEFHEFHFAPHMLHIWRRVMLQLK